MLDATTSNREEADNYHKVIVQTETHRVISCRDGIQWILQRRAGLRHGQPRWASLSYCITSNALIRLWATQMGEHSTVLGMLPDRIGGQLNG